jgi:NADH-quinone oxidoreductase subunit H
MLKIIIWFLIFPGFLFTAVFGLVATWADRKLTARLQWRQGPPFLQPFADIAKLLGKEVIVPDYASKLAFLGAPLLGLAGVTLVATMIWLFNMDNYAGFVGDLIVVIYLLMLPSISLMIGGAASGNPLSAIGSSREMKLIVSYELPFIIALFTAVMRAKTFLLGGLVAYQSQHGMLISGISGIIAFLVALIAIQAKLGFSPFDIAEAEQEIMGGVLLEYSGAPLAIFRLTKAMMLFTLPVFLITMFLGGIDLSSLAGFLLFIIKYVIILLLVVIIKNTNPRLRTDQAIRFFWGPVFIASIIGFVLALFGL